MKFIFMILFAMSALSGRAAAPEDPITRVVQESFNSYFGNAEEVSWTESKLFFKASFLYHGQYITAYFTKNGQLIATTKNLRFETLPLQLQVDFKEAFAGYWITDLFELTIEGGTFYYLTIENADRRIILESQGRTWSVFERTEK